MTTQDRCDRPCRSPAMVGSAVATIVWSSAASSMPSSSAPMMISTRRWSMPGDWSPGGGWSPGGRSADTVPLPAPVVIARSPHLAHSGMTSSCCPAACGPARSRWPGTDAEPFHPPTSGSECVGSHDEDEKGSLPGREAARADGGDAAVDVVLGGTPAAHADPHRATPVPGRRPAPAGSLALHRGDDRVRPVRVAEVDHHLVEHHVVEDRVPALPHPRATGAPAGSTARPGPPRPAGPARPVLPRPRRRGRAGSSAA